MSELRNMAARLRAAADALDAVQGIEIDRNYRNQTVDAIQAANTMLRPKRHITAEHKAAISRAWARRRRAAKKA